MSTNDDPSEDPELRRALREWELEGTPASLDLRVLGSYRSASRRGGPWRRLLWTPWPVPVALAFGALLLVAGYLAGRSAPGVSPDSARGETARLAQAAERPVVTNTTLSGFEPLVEVEVRTLRRESGYAR